jgi:hypothetical protein
MRRWILCAFAALVLAAVAPSDAWLVPWKVLNPGDQPPSAQLVVYWLAASRDDLRHSELLTSRTLTTYAAQCVAMIVVRPDDYERVSKMGARGQVPLVLLADRDGRELARIGNDDGALHVADVERSLRDEIHAREDAARALLDDAKSKCAAGEKDAAIALYRRVCEQRCLLPREAKEAQRALKKMGVEAD